jgi:hypothetical protein
MSATTPGQPGSGCFKAGCVGCLVIVGVPVLLVVGLLLLNVVTGRGDATQESRELTRAIPPLEKGLIPEEATGPGTGLLERLRQQGAARQVRVLLDVSEGEFRLEPGPAGEPLRVEAEFDTDAYTLSETLDPDDDYGWTYRLKFAPRRSRWLRLFTSRDDANAIRLIVPRGVPVVLEGTVGFGHSVMELGGLQVAAVDLRLRSGQHELRISEPLPEPIESFRWTSTYGEIDISGLGNASPEEVSVSHTAGEVHLDLRGDWRNAAAVRAYLGFGELTLDLPENAFVAVERSGVRFGATQLESLPGADAFPAGAPAIRLSLSGIAGEHRVRR